MKKINFLLGIHSHQPVGNFEHVFEESFERCYKPFLEILTKHPKVRCSLHYTGPLLEWIEEHRHYYFESIKHLVKRNQVELLTGGFYEPIITVIPRRDAVGQIQYMSHYIKSHFDYTPRGMWLAERVWEPMLPSILHDSYVEYSVLDESHFSNAGLTPDDMFGYYLTENEGKVLRLFPIDKKLRYLIPFRQPEETIAYFKELASDDHSKAVTMADDGEKFGVWPSTYDWVYNQGYLEKFFSMLEDNSDWITMLTFSEYIETYPPMGKIYLPTSSYEEMMEWALPSKTIISYENAMHLLEQNSDHLKQIKPFFKGGFWRNFLAKYHESNLMHKKMLWVSNLVNTYAPDNMDAKKELWRGECNCAYWHGLFGGLYLNYLRNAIYSHLNMAEKIVDTIRFNGNAWANLEQVDFSSDGYDNILLSSSVLNVYLDLGRGGSCFEIDYKPSNFNLTNTFSRKYEAYHEKLKAHAKQDNAGSQDQPQSIHDIVSMKEEGLEKLLFYDTYSRHSFVDHFLAPNTTLDDFATLRYTELGDFVEKPYICESKVQKDTKTETVLKRYGKVCIPQKNMCAEMSVAKSIYLHDQNKLSVTYTLANISDGKFDVLFGSELNLTFLAANDSLRYYLLPSGKKEPMNIRSANPLHTDKDFITLIDEWDNIKVELHFADAKMLWRFPIETVSQSEGGFEKTYQHSTLVPLWKLSFLPHKTIKVKLTMQFSAAK